MRENAPKIVLTLLLQGGSPSNMDQYSLEQRCTKFLPFITMWLKSTTLYLNWTPVESRYNALVGVQETGPRYKWIAL